MVVITELLENKHCLYRRLKGNMLSFKSALEQGEEVLIGELIREREEILITVDALDRQMVRAGYPDGEGRGAAGPKNGQMVAWIDKIKEIWQDIFHLNLECLQFAEVRCRDLQTEMAAMDREVQNVKKYLAPRPYTPRFIDMVK